MREDRTLELTAHHIPGAPKMGLVTATRDRGWMQSAHGAKRCLPIKLANEAGWWILNPSRFEVVWTGESHELGVQDPSTGRPPAHGYLSAIFGHGILSVIMLYLFRTDPGWNLLARGPANHPRHGIYALEGLVETDWSPAPFTMNWRFTAPNVPVVFEAGDPLCQIVPTERGAIEAVEPLVKNLAGDLLRQYSEWNRVRREARQPSGQIRDLDAWEDEQRGARGGYARGRMVGDSERFEGHQTRLALREFC